MGALDKALNNARGISNAGHQNALREKDAGVLGGAFSMPSGIGGVGNWQSQQRYRERYSLFRGWLYAAVNALASEAASQPINVGRMVGIEDEGEEKSKPGGTKLLRRFRTKSITRTMPPNMQNKAAKQELELLPMHPLVEKLEQPNPIQGRWQFTYSFVANLALTGWSFIVTDEGENGTEYYSLPTTWIEPDHTDGLFSKFKIRNPRNPQSVASNAELVDRENVAIAYLPNPSDPLSALAPAASQMMAIRIDDNIWTSREQFFQNGIFPSVLVTIGENPLGDANPGVVPRLSPSQRRQIYSAIGKRMGSVANYGHPAILDGLIKSITPWSLNSQEMGWEKSEPAAKAAILSAFCVHPYILGEPVGVGGYAQVANIEKRFYKRVNTYLDMLSSLMTTFASGRDGEKHLLVWWIAAEATDPQQRNLMLKFARLNNDITQDEFRAELGFGPDEDRNESVIQTKAMAAIANVLTLVGNDQITPDQAMGLFVGMGMPDELAQRIAGQASEQQTLTEATEVLGEAVAALRGSSPQRIEHIAKQITHDAKSGDNGNQ